MPIIVSNVICAGHLPQVRAQLTSTFLTISGIATILQVTIGSRLPIIQGASMAFIPPVVAMMALDKFRCPQFHRKTTDNISLFENSSTFDEFYKVPLREIQGSIILAGLTEMVIGCTGLVGFLLRFIGPITIMPTITLIGLSLFSVIADLCNPHWGIAATTTGMICVFSLYLKSIRVPFPLFSKSKGCHLEFSSIFKVLPVLLAVTIGWVLSGILKATGQLTDDPSDVQYNARADAFVESLNTVDWFVLPYPGQWGMPTVSVAVYLGMLTAVLASMVESVGDYYACAKISTAPSLPDHAVNRGIMSEGLAGILSGLCGSGGNTTSYSADIAAIGFTKVGSRLVWYVVGLIYIVAGIFGKVGAALTMIPTPVLGGMSLFALGTVSAIGISNLQYVKLSSSRNQCIIGVALMTGMVVPHWISLNSDAINTGIAELDRSIQVLLGTSMFLGGLLAFILDNTVPGTEEERGIIAFKTGYTSSSLSPMSDVNRDIYDIPFITEYLRKYKWTSYIPISPTYTNAKVSVIQDALTDHKQIG